MEKAKEVFRKIMTVLSVVIFVFGLFIFVSVLNASAGKVPSVLGFSFMQIQTGSMEPEYPVGSIVVTRKIDVDKLEKGDVISFYSSDPQTKGMPITHRIVEKNRTSGGSPFFTTKGDANDFDDSYTVGSLSIIGKVVYNIGTVGGSIISVLKNPNVIFCFIVLPLIFITFGEAVNLVTLIVKSKEENEAIKEENNEQSEEGKN